VTINGKPSGTSLLTINFSGRDANPVTAPIAPDGTYQVSGVPIGPVRASIGVIDLEADRAAERAQRAGADNGGAVETGGGRRSPAPPREPKPIIASKYTDPVSSGLQLTTEAGTNKFDMDLK
jgi:hypothetical protein